MANVPTNASTVVKRSRRPVFWELTFDNIPARNRSRSASSCLATNAYRPYLKVLTGLPPTLPPSEMLGKSLRGCHEKQFETRQNAFETDAALRTGTLLVGLTPLPGSLAGFMGRKEWERQNRETNKEGRKGGREGKGNTKFYPPFCTLTSPLPSSSLPSLFTPSFLLLYSTFIPTHRLLPPPFPRGRVRGAQPAVSGDRILRPETVWSLSVCQTTVYRVDKWVLTYPTNNSGLTHLFHGRASDRRSFTHSCARAFVSYTTLDATIEIGLRVRPWNNTGIWFDTFRCIM